MKVTAFAILLAGFVELGFAQIPASVLTQLRSGNPAAAESSFSALQKAFESGQITEYDLLDSYKVFYGEDSSVAVGLDRWVSTYPKSSPAHLARGVYYRKRGEARRGQGFIAKTPPADLAYMSSMFARAKPDLRISLQLNSKSYLAALHLLNIAQFEGDDLGATKALEDAISILPSNVLARARYTIHLTPRWGGSYDRIDGFIEHCRSQGVSESNLLLLRAIKLDDQGRSAEERGQTTAAISFYERALPLSKAGGQRFRRDYLQDSLRFCSRYKFGGEYCS